MQERKHLRWWYSKYEASKLIVSDFRADLEGWSRGR